MECVSVVRALGNRCSPDFFVPFVVGDSVHLIFGEMQRLSHAQWAFDERDCCLRRIVWKLGGELDQFIKQRCGY